MEKEIIESNGKKVSFITLGCKVNQYDSDAMRSLFIRNGYKVAKENENADVYVINTCSVTSIGDRKSRQMVRRIRREHPGAVIAAAGCYAQLAPDVFVQMGDVDVIVGIQNRSHIVEYVEEAAAEKKTLNAVGDIMAVTDFENLSVDAEGEVKTRAFIKVQEGCDNYCTFCIIPFARGKLKSRRQSDAVEEIRRLVPTRIDFKHQHDTPQDAAGHIKCALLGVTETFIVHNGKLLLGGSQGIYFLEFDGPRNREFYVKVVEDK